MCRICLLVLALSRRYVPETIPSPGRRRGLTPAGYAVPRADPLLPAVPDGPRSGAALAAVAAADAGGGPCRCCSPCVRAPCASSWRGDHPLLPPRLLAVDQHPLPGMAIALLFFSAWSGFMFCMALTMQEGLGMAPWQSGNSFIALGVAYFISALYAPRLIARYSMGRILLTGLAVRIAGLLLLCATFSRFGVATNTLTLVPATALIGYGQALIVNPAFYRIGMRDISASDAGAGSAILSTLQQATLGLGPAILGFAVPGAGPSRRRQLSAGAD
ncbi:MFS transporter [Escherichia coli]|nr:MFS transporter [Escherichia coli]